MKDLIFFSPLIFFAVKSRTHIQNYTYLVLTGWGVEAMTTEETKATHSRDGNDDHDDDKCDHTPTSSSSSSLPSSPATPLSSKSTSTTNKTTTSTSVSDVLPPDEGRIALATSFLRNAMRGGSTIDEGRRYLEYRAAFAGTRNALPPVTRSVYIARDMASPFHP